MEEVLNKVSELINKSNNIPDEIRPIVKAICRGYIRESKGKISIEGIMNVCNTTFIKIDENNQSFSGEEKILGNTETNYDKECNVTHKMSYINDSNHIKLISILTHELGHVITESKPCQITKEGIYPLAKRTTTFYQNCQYHSAELRATKWYGFRMADGFLESISTKIFASPEFRQELLESGYDLKDYIYKDERIFQSRIYDEYKACFELFDYIMNDTLFEFSCMSFHSNEDLANYINKHRLNIIFEHLDRSNDLLWQLKKYEGKEYDEEFEEILKQYLEAKDTSLNLAKVCLELYGKKEDDKEFQRLYDNYTQTLNKQKQLPIPKEYLKNNEHTL